MLMAAEQAPLPFLAGPTIPLLLVFVIIYVMMIRPQRKQVLREQEFQNNLVVGAEVFTRNGLIGKITDIADKVVTLELEKGSLKILRSEIVGNTKLLFDKTK
jgi:preprotein translocase subunit YajC